MLSLDTSIYVDFLFQSIYLIQNYTFSFPSSISLITSSSLHFMNNINVQDLLTSTIALFVVMDPIGVIPLYVSLTRNMSNHERKIVSSNAVITTGILLLVFAIAGTTILSIFRVTISSFMIAGGILLFIVAIELLTPGEWTFGNARTITNIRGKSADKANSLNADTESTFGGESGGSTSRISITCRARSYYICNDLLSIQRSLDFDIVNCNCHWSYLYYP